MAKPLEVKTTVLAALNEERIFYLTPFGYAEFEIGESCDYHFSNILTREQLLQLSDEIRAMAMEPTNDQD